MADTTYLDKTPPVHIIEDEVMEIMVSIEITEMMEIMVSIEITEIMEEITATIEIMHRRTACQGILTSYRIGIPTFRHLTGIPIFSNLIPPFWN